MKSEQNEYYLLCPVCGCKTYPDAPIDKYYNHSMKGYFKGFRLCYEHRIMQVDFIALVEVENDSYPIIKNAILTGNFTHIKRTAWSSVFTNKHPDLLPLIYVEKGVIAKMQALPQVVEERITITLKRYLDFP